MSLKITNPETERLARELARETGSTITDAITIALQERWAAVRRRRALSVQAQLDAVAEIQAFLRAQPDRDRRTPDEILGYDQFGLPG